MFSAILFIIFAILIPVILGCCVGIFFVKASEKHTGNKPSYNTIKFYIGMPCCIFMFIAITLFLNFVH